MSFTILCFVLDFWLTNWTPICEVESYLNSRRLPLAGPSEISSFWWNLTQPRLCQNRSFFKVGVPNLLHRPSRSFLAHQFSIFSQFDTTAVVSFFIILEEGLFKSLPQGLRSTSSISICHFYANWHNCDCVILGQIGTKPYKFDLCHPRVLPMNSYCIWSTKSWSTSVHSKILGLIIYQRVFLCCISWNR